eukprot:TRINITY_DN2019_c1_g1_i1.p1 TRINITY_DN2019_c1_g1~~TRINITY_DN2019_c1_g1_i1.p1  ORF type:complete len:315 (+),score=110.25 TRINITY_DN2019_c1_g1_i1:43-945(+)
MAAVDALKLVREIIHKVEHTPAAPAAASAAVSAEAVEDVKGDYTWEPLIPPGHTSFSWTGHQGKYPNWHPLVDVRGAELKASVEAAGGGGKRKLSTNKDQPAAAAAAAPAVDEVKANEPSNVSAVSSADLELFSKLDIRVGTIVEAAKHPDADALYLEKIDLGEEEPRQVISGLVAHITLDKFVNSQVLVFANLKPSKLRGQDSFGMVFCASSEDKSKVELIRPPAGSKNGERVSLVGVSPSALGAPEQSLNPKKKNNSWETAQPLFKTNDKAVATFNGVALRTAAGECKAQTLSNAAIS